MTFDAYSAQGHSGGPVWLNWQGYRSLVAVHTGGFPRPTAPFDIIANEGVRITAPLLQQLRAWMRVEPRSSLDSEMVQATTTVEACASAKRGLNDGLYLVHSSLKRL